jgi:N-acetylglucosaminyldiphosphoundecaprenol N-acetyl-beta-D-mannosaminyltransferase
MKSRVGGIYFDNVNMQEAVAAIDEMVNDKGHLHMVCTANLDHLATMPRDAEFASIYKSADLVLADGMPIVWLSHLSSQPLKERVAGSDLLYALADESSKRQPNAAEKTVAVLSKLYPGVAISGTHCPSRKELESPTENALICSKINNSKANVLLVGLGAPKQEKWIASHKNNLTVSVAIGVGASFDMAAGMVKRAPKWMQRAGLEWAFRLMQEPARLWKRYLGCDLPFLIWLIYDTLRQRRSLAAKRVASKTNTLL